MEQKKTTVEPWMSKQQTRLSPVPNQLQYINKLYVGPISLSLMHDKPMITAWINRFIDSGKKQKEERKSGELLKDEFKVVSDSLLFHG